jgi:hypothetical protein
VLYGHIHRHHLEEHGKVRHYAARSLIFAFNDPATNSDKRQLAFDPDDPFKELGLSLVDSRAQTPPVGALAVTDVVLSKTEFSGLSGLQQMIKRPRGLEGSASGEND